MEYFHWCGRWLATGLSSAVPCVLDITRAYPILLWVLGAIYLLAFHSLVVAVLRIRVLTLDSIVLTASLYALFWCGMVSPGESFYWFTGGLENHLSVALGMFLLAGMISRTQGRTRSGYLSTVAFCLLAACIPGTHELFGAVMCLVLLVGAIVALTLKSPFRRRWVWVAICGVVGLMVVVIAPGNVTRMARNPTSFSFRAGAHAAISQGLGMLRSWICNPSLLVGTFLFVGFVRLRSIAPDWLVRREKLWKIVIPVVWIASVVGCILGGSLAAGGPLGGRTYNGIYTIFLLGWFLSALVLIGGVRVSEVRPVQAGKVGPVLGGVLFSLTLLLSENALVGFKDMTIAPRYAREMDDRYAFIRSFEEREEMHVIVPPIEHFPGSFCRAFDLTIDPTVYANWHVSVFWGLKSIRVGGEYGFVPPDAAFDEHYYLSQYPDVGAGVRAGMFSSGEEHYRLYGDLELRLPAAPFRR